MCNVQLIPTLVASSTVHSDNLDPELSYEIGISGASSLADILRVGMSLLCFFPLLLILKKCTNYAEESAHYACMPRQKKGLLPLETVSGSFGCSFTHFSGFTVFSSAPRLLRFPQGGLAMILRFHSRSEGLGKHAQ